MQESFPKPENQPELPKYDPLRLLRGALRLMAVAGAAVLILAVFLTAVFFLNKYTSRSAEIARNFMGTRVELKAYGDGASSAVRSALRKMEEVSRQLNIFDSKSEISLINSMSGIAPVAVSRSTFDIIERSTTLSKPLSGVFDVSIGPLVDLWQFNKSDFSPPNQNEINETLRLVNYRNIEINPEIESVKLKVRGMKLNLGGVGKGFVIAVGRSVLVNAGIRNALISCGSSISCIGKNPDGSLWRVGVRDPRDPARLIGAVELMPGQALSTSGDYEQFSVIDGKRVSHIINPRTGRPASGVSSVTVLAGDSTTADILSTSVFVMGPWSGLRFLNSLENVEGLIVDANGNISKTAGFDLKSLSTEEAR